MAPEARTFYDRYWQSRDRERTAIRSRERAIAAIALLRAAGAPAGRLLDAGCGPGWALEELLRAGFDAHGIDASDVAVEMARARGLDARAGDLEHGDLGGPHDAIACLEVLEHLADPLAALERLSGAVRPGGWIVASLPNELHLPARLSLLAGRLPFGGHDDPHIRHFDRRRARRLFEAARVRVVSERLIPAIPPRHPILRAATRPLLAIFPGALSIASVYLLRRDGDD